MELLKAVEELNKNQKISLTDSVWKVFDENIFTWRPQTMKTGELLHISFGRRKPEPLGRHFNNLEFSRTEIMLCLDINRCR